MSFLFAQKDATQLNLRKINNWKKQENFKMVGQMQSLVYRWCY